MSSLRKDRWRVSSRRGVSFLAGDCSAPGRRALSRHAVRSSDPSLYVGHDRSLEGNSSPHNLYCRGAAWLAASFGYRSTDTFHDWMPLWHIGGQLHVTMSAVIAGGSLVQFRSFARKSFWNEVRTSRATVFSGFASILSLLMEAPPSDMDGNHTLRVGLIRNMSTDVKEAFERRFGVKLLDTYGMTECEPLTLPNAGTPAGSCGLPCPDFEIAILDDEDRPVSTGSAGEDMRAAACSRHHDAEI